MTADVDMGCAKISDLIAAVLRDRTVLPSDVWFTFWTDLRERRLWTNWAFCRG